MNNSENRGRSLAFSASSEPRFWWHRLPHTDYVPPIYANLSEEEWQLLSEWYEETSREKFVGECAVPLMTLLQGFVMGNPLRRIVQLGVYSGYSTLLLGFFLRQMKARSGLFTFEIDESFCTYTRRWVDRAGLNSFLQIENRSSLDLLSPGLAFEYLGAAPELVFVDSSHEYDGTLSELNLWYPALAPGGLMILHDTSTFAADFDVTKQGGVARAFREWRQQNPHVEAFSLNHNARTIDSPGMVYKDFCGVGLIHKPLVRPD